MAKGNRMGDISKAKGARCTGAWTEWMSTAGELIDTETVPISSEGGRRKRTREGTSLAAYPTPVRFDERGVKTGHGRDGGTPADERAGQPGKTNFDLNYRATPRLYANRVAQACRLERIVPKARPPNWPYRRFYRAPLSVPLGTSLGAP